MAELNKLHVVICPWLAFGHILPFLELAKSIARKGHKVSFICTPRNIKRLPRLPPHLSPLINLVSFPLPKIDDYLPEGAEATVDIPYTLHPYLMKAYDGLEPAVSRFLESVSPDWVIYDMVQHWLPPIATKMGIPCAYFGTFNAWSLVFFGPGSHMLNDSDPRKTLEDYMVSPEWVPFETTVSFRRHELIKMAESYRVASPSSAVTEQLRNGLVITGCDVFLVRTCEELESDWLKVLGDIQQKTILPVGLLPPSVRDSTDEPDDTWHEISEWLGSQNKSSVVYVALGTEATPSQDELNELARGLELSGLPFFWTLRSRPGSTHCDSVELPDGFEERTKGRGRVWTSWVPQLRILAHDSVGGFLTHCGWSSVIEGLQQGLPLIMLPMLWDQGLNARALTEKNVGVEVLRNEQDGSLTRNSVAESLCLVMVEERGRIFREKAREMSSMFGDMDLHERYSDNFVCYLQNHRSLHKGVK